VEASEIIENAEPPVNAIRKKKDSAIVVALNQVKDGTCDAYVSAGSTGATLVGGTLIVRRIKGVERAPLAPLIPTLKGDSLLIDCGANVDARPEWLHQFAHMGSIYMESAMNIKNPKVGLLNIGTEEEKGNELTKAAHALLKDDKQINCIGNVEARDVNSGKCDVVVCDAFAGNVCLKTMEGAAGALQGALKKALMSSPKTKIGALLAKKATKTELKKYDATNYGGAPMLGLKGLVVKIHGNAKAKEVKNALLQCITFHDQNVNGKIAERFAATSAEE
jgi:glycerol-3-phosphate acyltransferase PlsX